MKIQPVNAAGNPAFSKHTRRARSSLPPCKDRSLSDKAQGALPEKANAAGIYHILSGMDAPALRDWRRHGHQC
jgi:hypothetical protein